MWIFLCFLVSHLFGECAAIKVSAHGECGSECAAQLQMNSIANEDGCRSAKVDDNTTKSTMKNRKMTKIIHVCQVVQGSTHHWVHVIHVKEIITSTGRIVVSFFNRSSKPVANS